MVPRPLLLCAWLGQARTAGAHVVRGDNFAVPAAPGGCSGTAEFLGCFKDDQWDASKVKPPAKAHRALPYALPGCYDCKDGKTPDSKENPNPCKFAPNPPPCDKTKMTDDYCATLCLHWSASIPGSSGSKVWSATQFAYTCWCGTEEDGIDTGAWLESNRVDDAQCNTPCEGDKTMMCGGPSLNHVMLVECNAYGWDFVLVLGLVSGLYLGGGALLKHRTEGVPLTREKLLHGELLPHRSRWEMLRGLVADGVLFSKGRLGGGGGKGYRRVGESTDDPPDERSGGRSPKEKDKGRDKGSGRRRKDKEERKEKERGKTKTKEREKSSKSKRGSSSKDRAEPESAGQGGEGEGASEAERALEEQRETEAGLHQSQAKIKVVGING